MRENSFHLDSRTKHTKQNPHLINYSSLLQYLYPSIIPHSYEKGSYKYLIYYPILFFILNVVPLFYLLTLQKCCKKRNKKILYEKLQLYSFNKTRVFNKLTKKVNWKNYIWTFFLVSTEFASEFSEQTFFNECRYEVVKSDFCVNSCEGVGWKKKDNCNVFNCIHFNLDLNLWQLHYRNVPIKPNTYFTSKIKIALKLT